MTTPTSNDARPKFPPERDTFAEAAAGIEPMTEPKDVVAHVAVDEARNLVFEHFREWFYETNEGRSCPDPLLSLNAFEAAVRADERERALAPTCDFDFCGHPESEHEANAPYPWCLRCLEQRGVGQRAVHAFTVRRALAPLDEQPDIPHQGAATARSTPSVRREGSS